MELPPTSGRPSLPDDYVPGQVVANKYELVRRLGEGGMASVWVAHSVPLDIDVAIKFIRADVFHPQLAERLLQEARAAARLGHPAIVRISDFGETERGDPFIVMELLHGEDLGSALARRGRLSAVKAVRTLMPIAHALATAHEKGIVHRDLKPENIFLARTDDGGTQPKLVDFGAAKLDAAVGFERITRDGTAIGSPGYMSPEQCRGLEVDHRTDIWAFSVVLYEAITGRLPFDGKSYNALLRSIIEDTPPPMTNFAAGDAKLWAILSRGMAKDVGVRTENLRELGQALAGWLMEQGVTDDIAGGSLQAWLQWKAKPVDPLTSTSTAPPPPESLSGSETGRAPPMEGKKPSRRLWWLGGLLVVGLCFVLGFLTIKTVWGRAPQAAQAPAAATPPRALPPPATPIVTAPPATATPIEEPPAETVPEASVAKAPVPTPPPATQAPTAPKKAPRPAAKSGTKLEIKTSF